MTRRQTTPEQWLILDRLSGDEVWTRLRRLPRESGILLLVRLSAAERRRLRHLAKLRDLTITTDGPQKAARVHNMRELRRALLRRAPLILLSPLYRTESHPDWQPLPRMRAAAYARLATRRAVALGGMNARHYAKIAPLGFIGWAGISAFRI
jgi:hypothetical protein